MSTLKAAIKPLVPRFVLDLLREKTPIDKIMAAVEQQGFLIWDADALEVFGRDGRWHTRHYADKVKSLEVWELRPEFLPELKKNLPTARAKITDSYKEIQSTPNKYGLVVVDNSMGCFVDDPYPGLPQTTYCEHFDLFPDIFRVLTDRAVVIVNVIPQVAPAAMLKYPQLFCDEQLERRASFYGSDTPSSILIPEMEKAYMRIAGQNGFNVDFVISERRGEGVVYYMAIGLTRISR